MKSILVTCKFDSAGEGRKKNPKQKEKNEKGKKKKLNFLVQGLEDVSIIGQVFKKYAQESPITLERTLDTFLKHR